MVDSSQVFRWGRYTLNTPGCQCLPSSLPRKPKVYTRNKQLLFMLTPYKVKISIIVLSHDGLPGLPCSMDGGVGRILISLPPSVDPHLLGVVSLQQKAHHRTGDAPQGSTGMVSGFSRYVCHWLKSATRLFPTASARWVGTAFPICLYWLASEPENTQSSGKV